MLSSLQK